MNKLPATCLIEGIIPDPRKKKQTQAEKEHVSHYHTTYGGSMTLNWFNRINLPPDVQKLLSYPESCLLVTESGTNVGKTFTNVSMSEWGGEQCILVHSGSYAKLGEDVEVGTDITGFITPDFKVIQELCHEWCHFDGIKLDKKIFLMREENIKLYCQIIFRKNDEIKENKTFHIPFFELKSFVSEATSALFQRLIIQQKRLGEIDLCCLSSKGKVVTCNYRLLGSGYEKIRGEDTKVWGIRRTVWIDKKEFYCWDSLYNYYGRLVLRCQPANNHAMIPLWFKPVDERDDLGNFIGVLPPMVWACDMQIHSNFLLKQTELAAGYKTYLIDHPELRAILSDFLQKVLLAKPRSLIDFAKQFFQPFLLARPESANSSEESSDTSSNYDYYGGEGGELEGEGEGVHISHDGFSHLYPRGKSFRREDYFFDEDNIIASPIDMYALSDENEEIQSDGESETEINNEIHSPGESETEINNEIHSPGESQTEIIVDGSENETS